MMKRFLHKEIEQLLSPYPEASIAVALSDPSTGFRFNLRADSIFHSASLMKVPVMVEVFRRSSEGLLSLSDEVIIKNKFSSLIDQSPYSIEEDTDDFTYSFLGKALTIKELVIQMITVSSNIATNLLLGIAPATTIQATLKKLDLNHTTVLRGVEDLKAFDHGLNNTTTASDMCRLFECLLHGRAVSQFYDDLMIDILLSQRINTMIPAGLPPDSTKVAHKTGDITGIHHDAGIVYPTNAPPYILAILMKGFESHKQSAQLGAKLSSVVYKMLRR